MDITKNRNPELYKKLKNLVTQAFIILKEKVDNGEKFHRRTIEHVSLNENGELLLLPLGYREYSSELDYADFIFRYRDELINLPEWVSVKQCLLNDEVISKQIKQEIIAPFGGSSLDLPGSIRRIILLSRKKNSHFHFEIDRFDSVYREIEEYFYSNNVTNESFGILLGFDSESDEINLGDGVKIRRISNDEMIDLWRESEWFRALVEENKVTLSMNKPIKYLLQLTIEASKISYKERVRSSNASEIFDKVICALRLFKKGWVDYPFIKEKQLVTLSPSFSFSRSNSISIVPMTLSYKLKDNEIEDFKIFYKQAKNKIDCSKIAIKRFNETYRRTSVEDKLVDYIISLESLYDSGGYTLAHRAAILLGKGQSERKQIFLEIKKAWDMRSKIVHGSQIGLVKIPKLKNEYRIGVFVQKNEEYLRSSIKILLKKQRKSWIDLVFQD